MCGILAHMAFDEGSRISESLVNALEQGLRHRGPDSGGRYLRGNIALAVRRLSIMDLEKGDQPIFSDDKRYSIVFNGEIYNHPEIRQELEQKGFQFKTRSDTEVLLKAFIDQGPSCLAKLNGMFAFAIWDEQLQELFVARDRMGIKPLYYSVNSRRAMFCSELAAFYSSEIFPAEINYQAISDYLFYWYICEPKTILKDVFQLPPGSYAVIHNGQMTQKTYWEIPRVREKDISFADAKERLRELLNDSIRMQLQGDVPVGTFLSGGIDSGLITALASKQVANRLSAFSIGFKEESYSEIALARRTAERYKVQLNFSEITQLTPERLEKVFLAFDEPLGNASFVPTYFLAEATSQKVKVVLTGDGGDELFGGYPTYQAPYYQNMYRRTPKWLWSLVKSGVTKLPVSHKRISLDYRLKQLMKGIALPYQQAHLTWREVAGLSLQKELFHPDIWQKLGGYQPYSVSEKFFEQAGALSRKNQLMYLDLNTFLLSDHLRKVDRMTMAHSLEARIPFLDHRIVEFAVGLPEKWKVDFFTTKKILKAVANDYLPREVVFGKKKGLTSPIASWISLELKDYVFDQLQGGMVSQLFNRQVVTKILEEHHAKIKDHSRTIWSLLTLQVWAKRLKNGCKI